MVNYEEDSDLIRRILSFLAFKTSSIRETSYLRQWIAFNRLPYRDDAGLLQYSDSSIALAEDAERNWVDAMREAGLDLLLPSRIMEVGLDLQDFSWPYLRTYS